MSGGHFNYQYSTILDTYKGELEYPILESLIEDLCLVLKSAEWYKSGDTSKEDYDKDVKWFLNKWFKADKKAKHLAKEEVLEKLQKFAEKLRKDNK